MSPWARCWASRTRLIDTLIYLCGRNRRRTDQAERGSKPRRSSTRPVTPSRRVRRCSTSCPQATPTPSPRTPVGPRYRSGWLPEGASVVWHREHVGMASGALVRVGCSPLEPPCQLACRVLTARRVQYVPPVNARCSASPAYVASTHEPPTSTDSASRARGPSEGSPEQLRRRKGSSGPTARGSGRIGQSHFRHGSRWSHPKVRALCGHP
jgi:hypothetical protein